MDGIDFNKLWKNYVDTITNHYADFNGRIGRAQFWYYVLIYFGTGLLVSIIDTLSIHGGLRALYGVALFLPSVGITARRLHDIGRPGTWAWLLAVPVLATIITFLFWLVTIVTLGIGGILFVLSPLISLAAFAAIAVLVYFCAQPGQADSNTYGPVPPIWSPGAAPPAAKA
ncbi:MAG TPA: DUF805 domain-containing protein [Rhizomicrobium sp.]|nr:DUF805 domain-containing protein [Rhizomicrobium sp.]